MAQGQQGHLLGNRYRLDRVVGRGGMGTVWQAYDTMLGREVAVKEVLLPPGLSQEERDVLYERTFREARASARLNHPGVVTVHDVLNEGGRPWLVMEFVRARSLQDLIDEGPISPHRAAEIGRQTLEALRHAHSKGILHRDVKPSNVLITDEGRAVLTDFGIAQMEGESTLTQTGLVMGSPAYIPPERAQGHRAVPASDLWSLGATLYAAVEGRSPYERADAMASLSAVLTEPVPPPRNAGPLTEVLMGLLAREPMYRLTADQALPKLAEVASMPQARPRPVAPPPQVREFSTVLDETKLDETKVDEPLSGPSPRRSSAQQVGGPLSRQPLSRPHSPPSVGYGPPPPLPPQMEETVVDSPDLEATTRDDSGPRRQPPPPHSGSQPRTLVQGDWAPPPYAPVNWPQPSAQHQSLRPVNRYERERTKTVVIVTVAAILVVVAVLAGAFILRDRLNSSAPAPGVSGTATVRI
ncbi:serine/threonine-protein kinase [Thermomonospora curvata]|uniref:non-specific serine/threonine protein kinase n=1 Tax=Thermomonospora curvata (strain ATCC 19995 / DSM 43183 / JCM 3096 / KCTC 9072 / NBRC 15933 / NCIMB 10081 / Henssen B9) TaxID=471852 RepID=D1AE70_THECD|nr:serine/threonine-protein kinase [Thermomonospora curvata]ACY99496.1 serine/threonine protein kinase [Thermomonospora curvata DSM 43183]